MCCTWSRCAPTLPLAQTMCHFPGTQGPLHVLRRQSGSDLLSRTACVAVPAGRLANGAVASVQPPRGVDTALGRTGQQIHGFPKCLLSAANLFTVSKLLYDRLDSRPHQSVELYPVLPRGAAGRRLFARCAVAACTVLANALPASQLVYTAHTDCWPAHSFDTHRSIEYFKNAGYLALGGASAC